MQRIKLGSCIGAMGVLSLGACLASLEDRPFPDADATSSASTTSSGGGAGQGGEGGSGGAVLCTAGETRSCYSGPAGTEGVGLCVGGMETCDASGLGFGPCVGQTMPSEEVCATPGDDDCNGMTNEGGTDCSCVPGAVASCYSGPVGTSGVGPCVSGTQECSEGGLGYGPCIGETTPGVEICNTPLDDDCDGSTNEGDAGCLCAPGATIACYTGSDDTKNVGACKDGTQTCDVQGTSYGDCIGEVLPQVDKCDGALVDEDCSGAVNDDSAGLGCVCVGGASSPCYSGPAGTIDVGICSEGMQECNPEGTANGACVGDVTPKAEDCTTGADDNCDGTSPACTGTGVWSRIAGDGTLQSGRGVAFDATGSLLVTGQFVGKANLGGADLDSGANGRADFFMAKYNALGLHQWSKSFGQANRDEYGLSVAVDSGGNSYFTGSYSGGSFDMGGGNLPNGGGTQVFVAKFDAGGAHLWSHGFGGASDQIGNSIAVNSVDGAVVVGTFAGPLDFGGQCPSLDSAVSIGGISSDDIFVAAFNLDGACLWARRLGDGNPQGGLAVAVDGADDVYITGTFQGSLSFGTTTLTAGLVDHTFLARLSGSDGSEIWAQEFGGQLSQVGSGVSVGPGGSVALTGSFVGGLDFGAMPCGPMSSAGFSRDAFVSVFASDGTCQWQRQFGDMGSTSPQVGAGVAFDAAGNLLVTGFFQGTSDVGGGSVTSVGNDDAFLVKLDAAGTHLWSKSFGDATQQQSLALAVDSLGNSAIAGLQFGSADYGSPGAQVSAGGGDIFIATFSP